MNLLLLQITLCVQNQAVIQSTALLVKNKLSANVTTTDLGYISSLEFRNPLTPVVSGLPAFARSIKNPRGTSLGEINFGELANFTELPTSDGDGPQPTSARLPPFGSTPIGSPEYDPECTGFTPTVTPPPDFDNSDDATHTDDTVLVVTNVPGATGDN